MRRHEGVTGKSNRQYVPGERFSAGLTFLSLADLFAAVGGKLASVGGKIAAVAGNKKYTLVLCVFVFRFLYGVRLLFNPPIAGAAPAAVSYRVPCGWLLLFRRSRVSAK